MSTEVRQRKVADQIRVELSDLVMRGIKDPRLGFVTITEVRMSRDLGYARVFVSVLGGADAQDGALLALRRAGRYIRGEIGRRVRLRHVPELRFEIDRTLENSARIDQLLRDNPPGDNVLGDDPDAETPDEPEVAGTPSSEIEDRGDV